MTKLIKELASHLEHVESQADARNDKLRFTMQELSAHIDALEMTLRRAEQERIYMRADDPDREKKLLDRLEKAMFRANEQMYTVRLLRRIMSAEIGQPAIEATKQTIEGEISNGL